MRDFATTGDGTLTALALAQEVVKSGKTLQELASAMVRFPQVLVNVKNVAKDKLDQSQLIKAAVAAAEANAETRAEGALVLVEIVEETREDINYLI
jgi:phosphoglucosamine mutase